ncbi:MAG: hypothetical protein WAV79_13910, partial [Anaerolineae bacterium]
GVPMMTLASDSPCAGWLPLESPGKPRSFSTAKAPYPAGLRKVGRLAGCQPSQGYVHIAAFMV